jgi:hypothetical protein
MDSKTKFLVSIVVLAAAYGIGMSFYKYIVMKDIDLYYVEEGSEESNGEESEGEPENVVESEGETGEVVGTTSDEGSATDESIIDSVIDVQATSSATTTVLE